MRTLSGFLIMGIFLIGCKKEKNEDVAVSIPNSDTLHVSIQKTETSQDTKRITKITFEQVTSEDFNVAKSQTKFSSKPKVRITDPKLIQQRLKGIVTFEYSDEYLGIRKIRFRNGKTVSYDFIETIAVAYFPEEDILLCEGGHTTDISYNLRTGKETYDVGNPDYGIISPNGKYQFTKLYEGQECFDHFLQMKKGNEFEKVIEINDIFEKQKNKWLCVIDKEFWSDTTTLYFALVTEYKEEGNVYDYYKMKLEEK